MFVIQNPECKRFVAKKGHESFYTEKLQEARIYTDANKAREDAYLSDQVIALYNLLQPNIVK